MLPPSRRGHEVLRDHLEVLRKNAGIITSIERIAPLVIPATAFANQTTPSPSNRKRIAPSAASVDLDNFGLLFGIVLLIAIYLESAIVVDTREVNT